ncbi:hypothetical protein VTO73DRAFT_7387 [Trametes versicolor]
MHVHDSIPATLHKHQPPLLGAPRLAAVLPITPDTLSDLGANLRTLLQQPGALSEIVLVTPPQYHAKTRHTLQVSLSDEDDADVEISITPWSSSIGQELATLQAAQRLSTDWVLLLDEGGLTGHGSKTHDTLLLRTKPAAVSPLGSRGIDYYLDGVTCITPSHTPRKAAHLVPPMILPTAFLPPTIDSTPGTDHWAALGDYVSRSQRELSGGLVLGSSDDSSVDWCSRYAPKALDGSRLPIHILPDSPEKLPQNLPAVQEVPEMNDTHPGSVLVVVSTVDLTYISPIACGLLHKGHHVDLFVTDGSATVLSVGCQLPVLAFPAAVMGDGMSLQGTLTAAVVQNLDVVISVREIQVQSQFSAFLADHRPFVTHVCVPREDLPYTDWMALMDLEEWKNWHVPRVELSVITNDRPQSLQRLLSSLGEARYFGDTLDMRINIEQTADDDTLRIASDYAWDRGNVFLHHRIVHGGLLPAVVESWYPRGNDSYGLILEDDVELSPLFYAYLKFTLLRYRYGRQEDRDPHLFGISLYQQKNLELRPEGRHLFDARVAFAAAGLPHAHTPYLSQIPCSWGALYFPEHWREFHAYLGARLAEHALPLAQTVVPGVRSNRWTRSWKRYFIELVFLRGYVMLYPNYARFASLSTNHLEVGSHVRDVPTDVYLRKKKLFNLPLMPLPEAGDEGALLITGLLELPDERLPAWDALPVLDLLGAIVDQETVSQRGTERRTVLTGCEGLPSRLHDARELLCMQ